MIRVFVSPVFQVRQSPNSTDEKESNPRTLAVMPIPPATVDLLRPLYFISWLSLTMIIHNPSTSVGTYGPLDYLDTG